jgi:DNA-binding Lrp family transcriptional regulator
MFDELDLMLIDAIQLNVRGSWLQIGRALDIAPATAARRWASLTSSGRAWTNVGPGVGASSPVVLAVVELSCRLSDADEVGRVLAAMPQVLTVEQGTGEFDTVIIVAMPSLAALSSFLFGRLRELAGINRMRSHVFTRLFGGSSWRLGILSAAQVEIIRPRSHRDAPAATHREHRGLAVTDRALLRSLSYDGRKTAAQVAREIGSTTQAVKRRLATLQALGQITFRCDLARPLAGWHSLVFVRLEVPDADLDAVGRKLSSWRENRLCAAVASTPNLFAIFGLRSTADVAMIANRITAEVPNVDIAERSLILRPVKLHGRLLDDEGRASGVVPLDLWADDAAQGD